MKIQSNFASMLQQRFKLTFSNIKPVKWTVYFQIKHFENIDPQPHGLSKTGIILINSREIIQITKLIMYCLKFLYKNHGLFHWFHHKLIKSLVLNQLSSQIIGILSINQIWLTTWLFIFVLESDLKTDPSEKHLFWGLTCRTIIVCDLAN